MPLYSGSVMVEKRRVLRILLGTAVMSSAFLVAHGSAVAQGPTAEDAAQELAARYAPVVVLKAQDGECDRDGERLAPMSVDVLLDNPQILLRQVGSGNPVIAHGVSGADISDLGEGYYLDFPGDALSPGCIYERDYRRFTDGEPAVVYAHVVGQADEPDRLALQYWFFWYFNDWNNKHEGDWEGIQVVFDVGSVEEALAVDPTSVGYAQHEGGERADWDDPNFERRGTHPVVYSSVGSHASYFGSALYLGRSASEGFGCDSTAGPSASVEPEVVVLPDSVDDPDDPLAWLSYEGRWGERQSGPFNGPTGPAQKERWSEPFAWHDELRSSSVVVPVGDQSATGLVNAFCDVVELGSAQIITLRQNPARLLIIAVIALALVVTVLGRTDWTAVRPLPIMRRRRAGQIIKSAGRLYRSRPVPFLVVGLLYIPVSFMIGLIVGLLRLIPIVGALLDTDRDIGVVGGFLALVVGGLGHAFGFVIVTATVAVLMRSLESGNAEMSGGEAFGQTFNRIRELLSGIVRVMVIVGLLLVSVVGIPWGVRQIVRYQFLAPATMLEELHGSGALDRSTELVRGRWFHTAGVFMLLNAFVGLVAGAAGLLLLMALSGVPLWLFSIIVSASSALIVPWSSIGAVLLYGDAAAEQNELEPAELLEPARA